MPANLKDLRNRIRSVRNTEQITAAMKLVSTAKFGRAQVAVAAAKPYSKALRAMLEQAVAQSGGLAEHPLLCENDVKVAAVVVLSSERGLCGSYNSGVAKQAIRAIDELVEKGTKVAITCVGKKAFAILSRVYRQKGYEVKQCSLEEAVASPSLLAVPGSVTLITTPYERKLRYFVESIGDVGIANYKARLIGKLAFVSTRFESAGRIPVAVSHVLPLTPPRQQGGVVSGEPVFEPSLARVMDLLIPRSFVTTVQQVFLEAVASEHCARMAAMENATRNAKEMLKKLQIGYQRARQAAITKELIEIVSGAEAL